MRRRGKFRTWTEVEAERLMPHEWDSCEFLREKPLANSAFCMNKTGSASDLI